MSGATRRTLDRILDAMLAAFPTQGRDLGMRAYEGRVDDLSPAGLARRAAERRRHLAELAALPAGGEQEAADRDHLALVLAEEELLLARREQARRDPLWAGRVLGVTSYPEGPAATVAERADGLRRHLEQVPEALDGLAAGLEEAPGARRPAPSGRRPPTCSVATPASTGPRPPPWPGPGWPSGPRPRWSGTRPSLPPSTGRRWPPGGRPTSPSCCGSAPAPPSTRPSCWPGDGPRPTGSWPPSGRRPPWPAAPRPRSGRGRPSAPRPRARWPSAASSWPTAASCPCPATSRPGSRPPPVPARRPRLPPRPWAVRPGAAGQLPLLPDPAPARVGRRADRALAGPVRAPDPGRVQPARDLPGPPRPRAAPAPGPNPGRQGPVERDPRRGLGPLLRGGGLRRRLPGRRPRGRGGHADRRPCPGGPAAVRGRHAHPGHDP